MKKTTYRTIISLRNKKAREESGLFLVEGEKSVSELIKSSFKIINIIAIPSFIQKHQKQIDKSGIDFEATTEEKFQGQVVC